MLYQDTWKANLNLCVIFFVCPRPGWPCHKLSGAQVLTIDGRDPNVAIDANALITGSFQGVGTRQNSCVMQRMIDLVNWRTV